MPRWSLQTAYDDDRLHFSVKVRDENVVRGDTVSVAIDPRRLLDRLTRNRLGNDAIALTIAAPAGSEIAACDVTPIGRLNRSRVSARGRRVEGGYEIEFSVPNDNLIRAQGADWSNIQVGARLADVDAREEEPVEVLWRASRRPLENRSFAHVVRK